MKKIVIVVFALVLFSSCEKEKIVPESEIPQWLKTEIENHETHIEENPKSMIAAGSWYRTRWRANFYYEYHNFLSSSHVPTRTHDGGTLDTQNGDGKNYYKEKCCSTLIWQGPMALK